MHLKDPKSFQSNMIKKGDMQFLFKMKLTNEKV